MTWLRFVALGAVFVIPLLPGPSSAQNGSLSVFSHGIEGRDANEEGLEDLVNVPVGTTECRSGAAITLEMRGVPSGTVLDFWRSDGSSCADAEPRRDTQNRTCRWLFSRDPEGRTAPVLDPIPLASLVGEIPEGGGEPTSCPENTTSTFTIWVLAANSQMSTSEVNTYGSFDIALDTNVPAAPQPPDDEAELGVRAGQAVSVRWQLTGADLREHRVYVDPTGCNPDLTDGGSGPTTMDAGPITLDAGPTILDGGDADTDAAPIEDGGAGLDAGDGTGGEPTDGDGIIRSGPSGCLTVVSDVPERFMLLRCPSGTAQSVELGASQLEDLGVELGDELTIAVTAVDQARNEGPASVVCAQRIETIGPCADFPDGQCPAGCGCAVPGARGAPALPLSLALTLLGSVLWLRRWRRRR